MLSRIARKLIIGATLAALIAPAALADPLGTDPEPWPIYHVLSQ